MSAQPNPSTGAAGRGNARLGSTLRVGYTVVGAISAAVLAWNVHQYFEGALGDQMRHGGRALVMAALVPGPLVAGLACWWGTPRVLHLVPRMQAMMLALYAATAYLAVAVAAVIAGFALQGGSDDGFDLWLQTTLFTAVMIAVPVAVAVVPLFLALWATSRWLHWRQGVRAGGST